MFGCFFVGEFVYAEPLHLIINGFAALLLVPTHRIPFHRLRPSVSQSYRGQATHPPHAPPADLVRALRRGEQLRLETAPAAGDRADHILGSRHPKNNDGSLTPVLTLSLINTVPHRGVVCAYTPI